jgi:hypothetical protein
MGFLGSSQINNKRLLRQAFAVMGGNVYAMIKSIATYFTLLGSGRIGFSIVDGGQQHNNGLQIWFGNVL